MSAEPVNAAFVAGVVREIMATLDGDLSAADLKLYQEVEALAHYIREARREIAELETDEIRRRHIPAATDELDAIVAATEEATGAILDSAETIERVADDLDGEARDAVADAVTRIYEACNFQDITGQRITKVVKALQHIEQKIDALVERFGGAGAEAPQRRAGADEGELLNGPALPGEAATQAEIDALLASFD
ncbi:MAG: hypothetical protein BroJett029_38750 [Alphaproteobacteria bacterium]|nr:MAG: hypothetical protein BroJett029_38750 [Alphaproteobacteria bacterium]